MLNKVIKIGKKLYLLDVKANIKQLKQKTQWLYPRIFIRSNLQNLNAM